MFCGLRVWPALKSRCVAATLVLAISAAPSLAGDAHAHAHAKHGEPVVGVVVHDAVSPATAPGITTSAVYLTLENTRNVDVDLVAVESASFNMGHLHKTSMADGLMTMEPVAQLSVPPEASVTFEPGGLHIMLMGAKTRLKIGDSFPVTLVFASGEHLSFSVSVVKPGDMPVNDHGSMKMN